MAQQKKQDKYVSPVGIVKFAHLLTPNTRFKEDGEFSVDLLLDPKEPAVQAFKKVFDEKTAEARATFLSEAKDGKTKKAIESYNIHSAFTDDVDKDGNETGLLVFKAKQGAILRLKGKDPINKKVTQFDAKNNVVQKNVGRGSKLKVAVRLGKPFCNPAAKNLGLTVYLDAVQILELKEFGSGGNAESFGFGAEDGYVDEGEEQQASAAQGEGQAAGEANPDFD